MRRREFLQSASCGAGAAAGVARLKPTATGALRFGQSDLVASAASRTGEAPAPHAFTPCINQATTMKADFRTSMEAYSQAGFRAVELWLDSVRPFLAKESSAAARRLLADCALRPVSSCCEEDLFFPRVPGRASKLDGFKRKLDLSAQLGAPRFVMYSAIWEGVRPKDYEAAASGLQELGELGKQFGIVVGIEFIAGAKFLGCVETTSKLLGKVSHPNLGIQFDTFHFYAGVSKLEDLENLRRGEISFVHINDVPAIPRERLQDMDRVYVGTGVMPHKTMLGALARVYSGPVSFEAFQYASLDSYEVARKAFEGLSRVLGELRG
jgi:sugar phosphate isomerase/epimerase